MSDPQADPGFTPINPNPFIVGNPVRDRAMFFGRRAEFELVRKRFQHSTHGGLLVFCGERRSGKTSILFQILDGRLGPDFIPVLIDMQSMAIGSEIDFLTRLSDHVMESFGTDVRGIARPTFTAGSNHSATFQRFIQDVLKTRPGHKLILLFDEYELFENKIEAGLLAEDVLYILASLMEQHSVFLVFTGSQHLEERRREYWEILGKSIYKRISFLERDDAISLIRRPVEGRVHYEDAAVETIYRLTAGQPFYTQAICQSLIDLLNDQRTNVVTPSAVAKVLEGLVNNPLPQMIFLWDGLDRDEKLVLALLAESLPDPNAHAGVAQMIELLEKREYPLELERARVATTLEKLFKSDMLLRHDRAGLPEYAFRMDLWRQWIHRMHSVWQVMREAGLEIRPGFMGRKRLRRRVLLGATTVALAVAGTVIIARIVRRDGGSSRLPATAVAAATFTLDPDPADAMVYLDDHRMGTGVFRDSIAAGRRHVFKVVAAGYADTTLTVAPLAAGASASRRIALRALLGDLRVETRPAGAEVRVDGRPVGPSPVAVRGLAVAGRHRIEATLRDHGVAQRDIDVLPDTTVAALLVLEAGKADVILNTDPSGSAVRVDGSARGLAPLSLPGLALGRHVVKVAREGYLAAETTVVVTADVRQVLIALVREPPGVLVVQGDHPGQIYVDGKLIVENVQNSGPVGLPSGTHQVRVVQVSGDAIESPVLIKSGERAVYDYSKGSVVRGPAAGH